MRREKLVNIGIIGCGHWGSNHIRIFNALEGAKVRACCDLSASRLGVLRKLYPDIDFTSDINKVIEDKEIDAVVVATPTATHFNVVKSALNKGKHVLCEKPLSIETEESAALMSLARKKQRVLMVGYVFLFNNGIIELKDYAQKNALGKILYLHFSRTNLGPIRDDVDVVYDLASHDIAIASFLLGGWPRRVSANAGFFLRKNIADTAFVTLYYPRGVLANIHVSWLDPKKVRMLTCVGDRKMAVWDDLEAQEPIRIFDKGVIKEPYYSDYGEFQLLTREGEVVSPLVKLIEPLKNQNLYFLQCLKGNKKPLTDASFAHGVTKVLKAIERSINNKSTIQEIR